MYSLVTGMKIKSQKGIVHLLPLILVVVGIIVFILLASSASFKNRLFGSLYPTDQSLASANLPPDLNDDGVVNVLDFAIMLSRWLGTDPAADINGDGVVNVLDFGRLLTDWGKTAPSPSPSPSAPTSGTIWGAVDAAVLGECSAAAHDKYVVDGGDGFLYRIWHPQADPSGCVFAHEHGDDPKIMTDTWVRDNWDPRFGYAARRMTSTAEPNGHAEAHEGYKVFVANLGDVNDEGRKNLTPTLSYFHMGTGGPKRFTVQHHSNSIAYRYQTGTPYAATHLMLDTGGVSDACDPRAQAPTKDGMLLQNRCKLNSPYEIWGTAQTIKSGSRQIYQGFATPAVFDPITVFNRDNPTEVVYAWDPRVAAIKNFNDDWSGHRGCKRESYAQVGYFYNGGGPTTYYTDPMGNVVTQGTAGAIKQTLSASNAVGVLSTDDGLFQYKKATNYCQQIGKLGLKN